MNPLVSVIIPTWNRKGDLTRAIESVLKQSFQDFEILVCDDLSSDGTKEFVAEWGLKEPRLIWIDSEGVRGGCPAIPRNRGASRARGQWLAFLDSDDTWLPHKLERQLEFVQRLGVEACAGNAYKDQSEELFLNTELPLLRTENLLRTNSIICSSVLVSKRVFELSGGFPEGLNFKAYEDYLCWLKISLHTHFRYDEKPLLRYTTASTTSIRRGGAFHAFLKKMLILDSFQVYARRKGEYRFLPQIFFEVFVALQRALRDWCKEGRKK